MPLAQYYSALEGNPRHYLMARAIQFWTPGIPMVYYVGLLAGRNDHKVSRVSKHCDSPNGGAFETIDCGPPTLRLSC